MFKCSVIIFQISFIIFGLMASPGHVQDIASILQSSEKKISENKIPEAIESLKGAIREIWPKAGMGVVLSQLVVEPAKGYGMYIPKENNVYNAQEPIYLYVEPVGYNVLKDGDDYEFAIRADFSLKTKDGIELAQQKEFEKWIVKSRRFISDFSINLEYNITGLRMGSYVLETILSDMNGNSKISVIKEIRIR